MYLVPGNSEDDNNLPGIDYVTCTAVSIAMNSGKKHDEF